MLSIREVMPCLSSRILVCRVSSQAITSAAASVSSTRSVTSSRLPIGVGQTVRRPTGASGGVITQI